MKTKALLYCCCWVLLCCIGCSPKSTSYSGLMNYLGNPDNGVISTKSVAGVAYKVKYLPPDYLAWTELSGSGLTFSNVELDSVRAGYKNSLAFLFTIAPNEEQTGDVTRFGIRDYEEFSERIHQLSFELGAMLSITCGNQQLSPSIAQFERSFGLRDSRDIMVVFDANELGSINEEADLNLCFDDKLFATGINKFHFSMADLMAVPALEI